LITVICSFGAVLVLWDQVFGTYRRGGAPARVGVDRGLPRAERYLQALREALRNAV
jgi:sterol desaturase/sphingolipid hydroxylase (fatty acid hydroxylase superfamily)